MFIQLSKVTALQVKKYVLSGGLGVDKRQRQYFDTGYLLIKSTNLT
jgi:hypothetical protein